jgi:hypothetical protein
MAVTRGCRLSWKLRDIDGFEQTVATIVRTGKSADYTTGQYRM